MCYPPIHTRLFISWIFRFLGPETGHVQSRCLVPFGSRFLSRVLAQTKKKRHFCAVLCCCLVAISYVYGLVSLFMPLLPFYSPLVLITSEESPVHIPPSAHLSICLSGPISQYPLIGIIVNAAATCQVLRVNEPCYDWWSRSHDHPNKHPDQADERWELHLALNPRNDHQFNKISKTIR